MNPDNFAIISGRSNEPLARAIAAHLNIPLTPVTLATFPSGENRVEILQSVRNRTVFFIQSAYTYDPDSPSPNDYIMETVMVADACFRASARETVLVLPSLPYTEETEIDAGAIVCETDLQRYMKSTMFPLETSAPDDPEFLQEFQKQQEAYDKAPNRIFVAEPFTHPDPFKLVAKLLESSASGIHRILTVSLPRATLTGYFDLPIDDLPIAPVLRKCLPSKFSAVAVSDISLAKQASQIAKSLNLPVILMHRLSTDQEFNVIEAENENVSPDSLVIFIDDFLGANYRVFQAAQQFKTIHNCHVSLLVIHLFLLNPIENISLLNSQKCFDQIFITNSIKIPDELKVEVIDLSAYLAESIKCIHEGQSLKSNYF